MQFHIDNEAAQFMKDNQKVMKPPTDLQDMCADLKVLGRREFSHLIRLRHKYVSITESEIKAKEKEEREKEMAGKEEEDEDAKIDRELERTMQRMEKEKKRKEKKEKVQADKSELMKKMSVIASNSLDNDEDIHLSSKQWD